MSRVRTLRRGREASARALFLRVIATAGAVAVSLAVMSLLQVPLASVPIAEATPPPPPTELLAERTASSRTLDNHDGTFTTSLYPGPVHYRDQQGAWRPIGSRLVADAQDGYAWRNEANSFDVRFKQDSRAGYLALDAHGRRFAISLEGAAQVNAQTRQHGLTYPGVFPNVNLRYDLRSESVKETLVLANAQAPTSYRFRLRVPSDRRVHAARQSDGSWAFYMAPRARPVLVLDAPWAAEDGVEHPVQPHASLAVTRAGDDFLLDLSVDGPWLRDPSRRFPVRVDPTITIQPDFQDASFDANCLTCKGTATDRLPIGSASTSSSKWRAALQFTLSDIPSGATVNNARLKLYFDGTCLFVSGPTCGGTAHQIDAHRMTQSWSKASTTAQLGYDPVALTNYTLPASAGVQWMDWNLTTTVQNWVSGTQSNFGLLLKRTPEPAASSGPMPPSRRYAPEPALGPKLEVTYNGEGAQLLEPDTLHANGAELRWLPYAGPMAPPFDKYEVHRSTSPTFTPTDSTRLMTTLDSTITSYRDTTAKASTTFTYKIVANNVESNPRTVTLPAAGQAQKVLRPDPAAGRDGYITYRSDYVECANRGTAERLKVGTDTNSIFRSLLRFDLGDLPTDTTVSAATLQLWHPDTTAQALTVRAHRLTAAWAEGTESSGCSGDGATWYETTGGAEWLTSGGDFDAASVASLSVPAGQAAGWHSFSFPTLVQQWARGERPNHGLLFKADPETIVSGKFLDYYASDFEVAPTLRPKLSVTYSETTSAAFAPGVSISKPAPSELVKGAAVPLTAGASDDRRVDSVQFFVDGNSVGTDFSEPFSVNWNSTSVANGSHSFTARATDDAGNQTTSSAVNASVGNVTPPTTSITSPTGGTVTGTVAVTATASLGTTKVELYADDLLVGTDTSAPYTFSWNTLDPALPAYDGSHTLKTKAHDAYANVTSSAPVTVTAGNAAGTKYLADFSSSAYPLRMEYVPGAPSQQQYAVDVTVTNWSGVTWAAGDVLLRYRWFGETSPVSVFDSSGTALGSVLPNGSVVVPMLVTPPNLPPGTARATYKLRFDLFDQPSTSWFGDRGNKPLENPVPVGTLSAEEKLGVEPYFSYVTEDLGLGMQNLVNVATGNSVVRWTPLQAPGIGIPTVVQLTYNSIDGRCNANSCPAGNGWSLAISSLTRFGKHMFKAQGNELELVDADGTLHKFQWAGDHWAPPAGTHLYIKEDPLSKPRRWAVTRPDRMTYFYDCGGNPTFVRDRNDNELRFEFDDNNPESCSATKQVIKVYDARNRFFELHYEETGNHNKRVKWIKDHLGHQIDFVYDPQGGDHGNLIEVIEHGGTTAKGEFLPNRSVKFTYETSGSQQNRQLLTVRDPLGVENPTRPPTTFAYYSSPGSDDKLQTRTDRENASTGFTYGSGSTTVAAPLGRSSTYTFDADGIVTRVVNPLLRATDLVWDARHLEKVIDVPTQRFAEYTYNHNGLVTDTFDELGNHTKFTYVNSRVRGEDQDDELSISDLTKRTDPNGTATPLVDGDYEWNYDYYTVPEDPTRFDGNLKTVTDPLGKVTTFDYHAGAPEFKGALKSVVDANLNPTNFLSYDNNGFPEQVKDANNQITRTDFDEDGLLLSIQDPLHAGDSGNPREFKTVLEYDSFHRLGRLSEPKSTRFDRGKLIWTETHYDANDNVLLQRQPDHAPGGGEATTMIYNRIDLPTEVAEPEAGERTTLEYDAAGRLTKTTLPRGVGTPDPNDFVTENVYDLLDRVVTRIQHPRQLDQPPPAARKTHYCYDGIGDLRWVTAPKANVANAPTGCAQAQPPTPPQYTTRLAYDDAHRLLSATEPLDTDGVPPPPGEYETRTRSWAYDANGNTRFATDEVGNQTELRYTQRNELEKTIAVFDSGVNPARKITSVRQYDPVGNLLKEVSPRAWDNSSDPEPNKQNFPWFVTDYRYDKLNRVDRIALPTDSPNPRTYIHRSYDANGNLTLSSLPVSNTSLAGVPDDRTTTLTHWDPGWIKTSADHVAATVKFDYTAEGWQSSRDVAGGVMYDEITWSYYPDGALQRVTDRDNQGFSTYSYDLNDNLTQALERRRIRNPGQTPYTILADHNGFDELNKTRQKQETDLNYRFTAYSYDANGNLAMRDDDGVEPSQLVRRHVFAYDESDQLLTDFDWGADKDDDTADDHKTTFAYFRTGRERQKLVERRAGGTWPDKVKTDRTYFASGDQKTLQTYNDAGQLVEDHTLEYIEPSNDDYQNGQRVSDTFLLKSPQPATAPCDGPLTCTTTYTYGPRDNLVREDVNRPGGFTQTNTWEYDEAMNVKHETIGSAGRSFEYAGNRLTEERNGSGTTTLFRYFYNNDGNLHCVTAEPGSSNDCSAAKGAPVPQHLRQLYDWDPLSQRPMRYRSFLNQAPQDDTTYDNDPLARTVFQLEKHPGSGSPDRKTRFTHLGLSALVSSEEHLSMNDVLLTRKRYAHAANGERIGMTKELGTDAGTYYFGRNVHSDVSLLLRDDGNLLPQAAYGYQAYGKPESALSQGDDTDPQNPLNPYRFNDQRFDSGSGSLDMGARRYSGSTGGGRFAQSDFYLGALSDLGVALDPLHQNRYAFAAGNPVGFMETDGHSFAAGDGGGPAKKAEESGGGGGLRGFLAGGGSNFDRQVDFARGFGDAAADTGKGLWELEKWSVSRSPLTNPTGYWKNLKSDAAVAKYIGTHPRETASATWTSMSASYTEGGSEQMAGRIAFDVVTAVFSAPVRVGATGARTAGAVGKAGGAAKEAPSFVYRGGAGTPDNLTPRPGKDLGGLSTFDNLEAATPPGGKAQVIDTSKLKCLAACPDAPPAGHVSLRPGDPSQIPSWAATRGTGQIHPFTQEILDAIVRVDRRPR